jgi:hypothetical protein
MTHGLVYRVKRAARQIGEQHAQLDQILRELSGAVEQGRGDDARELLFRYRAAIEAHFSLEEEVFFPALHGLHPEHVGDLEGLGAEHAGFRQQIERLGPLLAADLAGFAASLRSLVGQLSVHESREERLVRALSSEDHPRD